MTTIPSKLGFSLAAALLCATTMFACTDEGSGEDELASTDTDTTGDGDGDTGDGDGDGDTGDGDGDGDGDTGDGDGDTQDSCAGIVPTVTELTPDELEQMLLAKDFELINVHIPYAGEIPGTDIHIAYTETDALEAQLDYDLGNKAVLYCLTGPMSAIDYSLPPRSAGCGPQQAKVERDRVEGRHPGLGFGPGPQPQPALLAAGEGVDVTHDGIDQPQVIHPVPRVTRRLHLAIARRGPWREHLADPVRYDGEKSTGARLDRKSLLLPANEVGHQDLVVEVQLRLMHDVPAARPPAAPDEHPTQVYSQLRSHHGVRTRRARLRIELARDDLPGHVLRQSEDVLVGRAASGGIGHGWQSNSPPCANTAYSGPRGHGRSKVRGRRIRGRDPIGEGIASDVGASPTGPILAPLPDPHEGLGGKQALAAGRTQAPSESAMLTRLVDPRHSP